MIRAFLAGLGYAVASGFILAFALLVATPVDAKSLHPRCNIDFPCQEITLKANKHRHKSVFLSSEEITPKQARRAARADRYRNVEFGGPLAPGETQRGWLKGLKSSGLVAPLAAKLASIQSACPGTVAISGVRHTYIAGTKRISLHASGKAVDVRGPYGCIYAQLWGWQGGYSTDAGRVKHIHISYDADGGREMGLAFQHGGGRKYARRAHRHRQRTGPGLSGRRNSPSNPSSPTTRARP